MVGVISSVWNATEPWTVAQQERARTHPYLTGRMFARVAPLAPIVACASQHHERLDGSGYPHGLSGNAISTPARVLAAADVYHALRDAVPVPTGVRRRRGRRDDARRSAGRTLSTAKPWRRC